MLSRTVKHAVCRRHISLMTKDDRDSFLIRAAKTNDAESLAALSRQLLLYEKSLNEAMGELTGWAASAEEIRKQLLRPNNRFFLAEKNGEVIGFIKVMVQGQKLTREELGLLRWALDRMEQAARNAVNVLLRRPRPNVKLVGGYIAGIYVHPAERRTKIGRQLLSAAETWLLAQSIPVTELQVLYINETARRFWEAAGYQPLTLGMRKKL
ncbi:MAG TPA: GNAT family N-acetyltransferase [Blastocatellia bacterium]|nr:GNAT family N-acetyltransferase [Blastocatellia bacterium]